MDKTSADSIKYEQKKIWIDLDNTPHVPFFIPIKRELERRGYKVVLTARDAFQVCELAEHSGLEFIKIGRHYGKHMVLKLLGLIWRTLQLVPFVLKERPDVALSHGARSQAFLSNIMRIPSILIMDYEHSKSPPFCHNKWVIIPDAIPIADMHTNPSRVRQYPGIKEDVYAPEFRPDSGIYGELGIRPDDFVVTMRPPANEAHYHNPESEVLFETLMKLLFSHPEVRTVLLPRNKNQEKHIRDRWPEWFENNKTIVPAHAVNGMQLLWHSDLVISGGGTMNREAAALGVPVYSIFRGKTGAVDRRLELEGRLVMIRNEQEVKDKIQLQRRDKSWKADKQPSPAMATIVDHIESIIRIESGDSMHA